MWDSFRLVRHVDAPREARYGVCYSKKKPLSLAALGVEPGIWERLTTVVRSHGVEPSFVPGHADYSMEWVRCQLLEEAGRPPPMQTSEVVRTSVSPETLEVFADLA